MRAADKNCKRFPEVCGDLSSRHSFNPCVCQLPKDHEGPHDFSTWDWHSTSNPTERSLLGTQVVVNTCDGIGGPATIVGVRHESQSHFKVRMNDGSQPDFWAYDGELDVLGNAVTRFAMHSEIASRSALVN